MHFRAITKDGCSCSEDGVVTVVQHALCWAVIMHRATTSPWLSIQPAGGQSYCFQSTFCSFKWTRTIVSGISGTWKWPKEIHVLCEVVPSGTVLLLEHLLWSRAGIPNREFQRQKTSRMLLWLPYRLTLPILPRVFIAECLSRWKSNVQLTLVSPHSSFNLRQYNTGIQRKWTIKIVVLEETKKKICQSRKKQKNWLQSLVS